MDQIVLEACAASGCEARQRMQAYTLADAFNRGPLAAAVSPQVLYRLLRHPTEQQYWFLSYRADAVSVVVIADTPYACAAWHARTQAVRNTPENYKESALTVRALQTLHAATRPADGVRYKGARSAATFITLHVLGLVPLGSTALWKYDNSATRSLGLLPAAATKATVDQLHMRDVFNAARYVVMRNSNFVDEQLVGLSNQETTNLRANLDLLARAVVRGFVNLSGLDRYRDPDADGFIDKQKMLTRLEMPDGFHLIDVTLQSHQA